MASIIYKIDTKTFSEYVKTSKTFTEILKKCNLINKGCNINTVKRRIEKEKIDSSHIVRGKGHNAGKVFWDKRISKEDALNNYFTLNSKVHRQTIKNLIKRYSFKEYKCEECGLRNVWNNNSISLQLDHINGINDDNRLENLRFLCPNCHSQTDNFAGKVHKKIYFCKQCNTETKGYGDRCFKCIGLENRKVDRPSKEILEKEIKENSFVGLGKKYGVSDNAVRKWCKSYKII